MAKKARGKSERLLPQARPIILCDDVLSDPETGNVHLIGVFDAIRPRSIPPYPHRQREFCVFLQLTDAEGELPAWVQIVEAKSQRLVYHGQTYTIHFDRRTSLVRVVFRMIDSEFPRPGIYWVKFYCDGQYIADHPVRLLASARGSQNEAVHSWGENQRWASPSSI